MSTVIAGKNSNVVGNKDSTLVLRGTSIKVLWGNKFIDIIKNGKINVESEKILQTADSIDSVTKDGIYLIEDSIWTVIGGTKVLLSGDNTTTYVSYLTELKDITPELKLTALTNIGFYYNTLEEAKSAGLTSGIIYILGDNKLYLVKEGILSEYITTKEKEPKEETPIQNLYISEYSLIADDEEYITCDNTVNIHKLLIVEQEILSEGATSEYGYRLYMSNGKSYLEIDNIIQRNSSKELNPTKYYLEDNLIISVSIKDGIILTLLNSNKYAVGDTLITYIVDNNQPIPVNFLILEILEDNEYLVSTDNDSLEESDLINKSIFYKLGLLPIARILDCNFDLFKELTEQNISDIKTRIGNISEIELVKNYTEESLGIYSDNAVLYKSSIVESNFYDAVFKLSINYPRYEDNWIIPEDSNDLTIVTSLWVLDRLTPIKIDIETLKNKNIELTLRIEALEEVVTTLSNSITTLTNDLNSFKEEVSQEISNIKTLIGL